MDDSEEDQGLRNTYVLSSKQVLPDCGDRSTDRPEWVSFCTFLLDRGFLPKALYRTTSVDFDELWCGGTGIALFKAKHKHHVNQKHISHRTYCTCSRRSPGCSPCSRERREHP